MKSQKNSSIPIFRNFLIPKSTPGKPIFISTGSLGWEKFTLHYIFIDTLLAHLSFSSEFSGKAEAILNKTLPEAEIDRTLPPFLKNRIGAFLSGKSRRIDIPINPFFYDRGSLFQKKVWENLAAIPYGSTRSYGQIAEAIGNPRSARAIGQACGSNPLALIIPCHRVTAAKGLGGFNGGAEIKQLLLTKEKRNTTATKR